MPERWTRAVLRHRGSVLLCWLAVFVVGALTSVRVTSLLSNTFNVPGTESDRARMILDRNFGERPGGGRPAGSPAASRGPLPRGSGRGVRGPWGLRTGRVRAGRGDRGAAIACRDQQPGSCQGSRHLDRAAASLAAVPSAVAISHAGLLLAPYHPGAALVRQRIGNSREPSRARTRSRALLIASLTQLPSIAFP